LTAIIMIDAEREYGELTRALQGAVLEISPSSPQHINPLDINRGYGAGENPVAMKSELMMSICEQQMGVGQLGAFHMTEITSWVETIDHSGGDDDDGWTEYILHITITPKTADEMRTIYVFTKYQNEALDELLADRATLASLASSLTITNADAVQVLQSLPADLSQERKAVVQNALTLYGKVSYFWGGKSLVIGWDSRWGELRQVTAAGSSTTGTYRPYGLDCSGFVDWAFYNATGGSYIIGHGGGATMQHSYCTDISWSDAQPGDLVFYPDNSHVGIICGRDEDGSLLVIHCASGANNVVITGTKGFASVARPDYYGE
jgi:cell wall-associated NlpC family hydrolase